MKETFGQRLSRIRKEKGYTQEDIASKITISPQAVSKWENDISSPDILILSSLADILGVSVDELLGREGEKHSSDIKKETIKKDDEVRIDSTGIHLIDKDGEELHIGEGGIKHIDKNGHLVRCPKTKISIVSIITCSILAGLSIIGLILMGLLWKDGNLGWKLGWELFLLVPIVGSIFSAIEKKKITHFAYPVLVVVVYVTLGFLGSHYGFAGWSFYWFLFLTIPAFYIIFGSIDKYVFKSVDEDDDDEE